MTNMSLPDLGYLQYHSKVFAMPVGKSYYESHVYFMYYVYLIKGHIYEIVHENIKKIQLRLNKIALILNKHYINGFILIQDNNFKRTRAYLNRYFTNQKL